MGFSVFTVVNTPSLKVIFGNTPLLNLATLSLLAMAIFARTVKRRSVRFNRYGAYLGGTLFAAYLVTVLPEFLLLRASSPGFEYESFRFLYVVVIFFAVLTGSNKEDARSFLFIQTLWGGMIAGLFLAGLVTYARTDGQHYNTMTLPIGLGLMAMIGYFVSGSKKTIWHYVVGLVLFAISALALLNLAGRSPYVFSALILTVYLSVNVFSSGGVKKLIYTLVSIISLVAGIGKLINYYNIEVSSLLIYRFNNFINHSSPNTRISIYTETLQYYAQQPLGYGLGAYDDILHLNYPHNLLLEILFGGGLIPAVLLSGMLCFFGITILRKMVSSKNAETIQVSFVSAYLFLTFMLSYSISDSYMLFAMLALATPVLFDESECTDNGRAHAEHKML